MVALGAWTGGGFGLFMGMLLGALDNPLMQEEMTAKQQFIHTAKQMGRRSWSSAKTFAVMGLLFSAAECVVEKVSKHGENHGLSCSSLIFSVSYSCLFISPGTSKTRYDQYSCCWLFYRRSHLSQRWTTLLFSWFLGINVQSFYGKERVFCQFRTPGNIITWK